MAHRILFVESAFGFGGSVVALARLLRALPRDEFEPWVLVRLPEQAEHLRAHGGPRFPIDVEAIAPAIDPGTGFFARIRGAADHMRRHVDHGRRIVGRIRGCAPELVHVNNGVAANYGAARVSAKAGLPVVVKQHGYEWHSGDVRRLAAKLAHFLPDSAHVADDLAALGVPRDRMTVTWCPVDLADFARPVDVALVRAQLGVAPGAQVVGMVGMLIRWKGQHVFLQAMAKVLRDRPRAHALVVGGPADDADPQYPQELRALAASLGIEGRVTFTGLRSDVPAVLAACDVCVHASVKPEPFGMVVAEAMAAGRPVVASAAGGPVEQVEEGASGFLVAPGDADALADRIARLLDDPARAVAMGARGRTIVAERFSAERHAALTADVYRRALGRA